MANPIRRIVSSSPLVRLQKAPDPIRKVQIPTHIRTATAEVYHQRFQFHQNRICDYGNTMKVVVEVPVSHRILEGLWQRRWGSIA